ncbi:MAG: flagellar biosynthesis anti-sigma factor FlgM [Deltaproteobacteria bacterium]|nr:MAG: flagellar biosynthesis anti-sigma factor FlgM [Deltaproteobacteria bacterium]
MSIHNIIASMSLYKTQALTKTKAVKQTSAQPPASPPDKVSFSDRAKLLQSAGEAAQASSGIRTDTVDALKEQIDAGRYQPNAQDIARQMLHDEHDLFG